MGFAAPGDREAAPDRVRFKGYCGEGDIMRLGSLFQLREYPIKLYNLE
jgi:hypothetical protein